MEDGAFLKGSREGPGERDLKTIEYPSDPKGYDHQRMKSAPGKPVQSRWDVGHNDWAPERGGGVSDGGIVLEVSYHLSLMTCAQVSTSYQVSRSWTGRCRMRAIRHFLVDVLSAHRGEREVSKISDLRKIGSSSRATASELRMNGTFHLASAAAEYGRCRLRLCCHGRWYLACAVMR